MFSEFKMRVIQASRTREGKFFLALDLALWVALVYFFIYYLTF